jgi:hypothetical protein
MSGLSHTPGKRAKGKTFRGFESRLLRQDMVSCHPSHDAAKKPLSLCCWGFFVASQYLLEVDLR